MKLTMKTLKKMILKEMRQVMREQDDTIEIGEVKVTGEHKEYGNVPPMSITIKKGQTEVVIEFDDWFLGLALEGDSLEDYVQNIEDELANTPDNVKDDENEYITYDLGPFKKDQGDDELDYELGGEISAQSEVIAKKFGQALLQYGLNERIIIDYGRDDLGA